jgi:uncharacterized protein
MESILGIGILCDRCIILLQVSQHQAPKSRLSVTVFDAGHTEDEERWITIGRAANGQCLLVVHTWTEPGGSSAHARIISAREPKNSERQSYEEDQ